MKNSRHGSKLKRFRRRVAKLVSTAAHPKKLICFSDEKVLDCSDAITQPRIKVRQDFSTDRKMKPAHFNYKSRKICEFD